MEARIHAILEGFARRMKFDPDALRDANRKQAMVPEGAIPIDPAGTAPGLVVPARELVVIVLPGPPRELQAMWEQALATEPVREILVQSEPFVETTIRMFGIPESSLAQTLREVESEIDLSPLEITTCLRRAEIVVDVRRREADEELYETLLERLREAHGRFLFSEDGSTVDEQLAELLRGRSIGLGESCTAGLLAARLTERPGASAYVKGGVVAYSNEAKTELLGVPAALIEEHGAVSPEVAEAMADGAIERFGAELGVGITGIAGPGRRHRGEAGRLRLRLRQGRRRREARARPGPSRRPRRHPRPLGDRRDAHAAAPAAGRGAAVLSEVVEPFEPKIEPAVVEDLRERLARTRWPDSQPRPGATPGSWAPTSPTCASSANTGRPNTTSGGSSGSSASTRTCAGAASISCAPQAMAGKRSCRSCSSTAGPAA